eukprot:Pompholyxophrys_punicea_v1_NODE_1281_length_816_cov_11.956636.p1 type:complete len:116 gc:universal NODE_1281_length_816_cov_11.956636:383-36(-)
MNELFLKSCFLKSFCVFKGDILLSSCTLGQVFGISILGKKKSINSSPPLLHRSRAVLLFSSTFLLFSRSFYCVNRKSLEWHYDTFMFLTFDVIKFDNKIESGKCRNCAVFSDFER